MERPIIEHKISDKLKKLQRGRILFVDDFLDYGNSESIKKALARLTEKDVLVRIAHGIYLYPKKDKKLGILYPSIEEVAAAIARRDKTRTMPTGVHALNKLGISQQIPLKAVYLTDGASRNIKIGRRTITFKKTTPRNLLAKGEISGLVIQALKSIGQKGLEHDILKKVEEVLKKEKKENIEHDAKLSPAWINKILLKASSKL